MLKEHSLQTNKDGFYDITSLVANAVADSNIKEGIVVVWCHHTTAGITVNENADPDVVKDILLGLSKAFPGNKDFRHFEGNSTAHLKSSCVGVSKTIIVHNGRLLLGTWQGIYFCEFDGPRTRKFFVKVVAG